MAFTWIQYLVSFNNNKTGTCSYIYVGFVLLSGDATPLEPLSWRWRLSLSEWDFCRASLSGVVSREREREREIERHISYKVVLVNTMCTYLMLQ